MAVVIKSKHAANLLGYVEKHISSPEQRLILGATALASQPFIDLYNRNVDRETRVTSAQRTVAKIIVGTTTGVIVRALCIKMARNSKMLLHPEIKNINSPEAKKYINAMGTVIGTAALLFTNFIIDAPLTKFLTNYFGKREWKEDKIAKNP